MMRQGKGLSFNVKSEYKKQQTGPRSVGFIVCINHLTQIEKGSCHLVSGPAQRRAFKEGIKIINHNCVNNQACCLQ